MGLPQTSPARLAEDRLLSGFDRLLDDGAVDGRQLAAQPYSTVFGRPEAQVSALPDPRLPFDGVSLGQAGGDHAAAPVAELLVGGAAACGNQIVSRIRVGFERWGDERHLGRRQITGSHCQLELRLLLQLLGRVEVTVRLAHRIATRPGQPPSRRGSPVALGQLLRHATTHDELRVAAQLLGPADLMDQRLCIDGEVLLGLQPVNEALEIPEDLPEPLRLGRRIEHMFDYSPTSTDVKQHLMTTMVMADEWRRQAW
jgi:hypothetical protein